MQARRQQLTLFVTNQNETIEKIRATYNPVQFNLIAAHVTLCREPEIEHMSKVIENIRSIGLGKSIKIEFGSVERFADGKGVLIPAKPPGSEFHQLRRMVLEGLNEFPGKSRPHITLIHPRNGTCTDKIFEEIKEYELPTKLSFDCVSLIEQVNGSRWMTIEQFSLTKF